jgi:hypothetical protein
MFHDYPSGPGPEGVYIDYVVVMIRYLIQAFFESVAKNICLMWVSDQSERIKYRMMALSISNIVETKGKTTAKKLAETDVIQMMSDNSGYLYVAQVARSEKKMISPYMSINLFQSTYPRQK